MVLLLLETSCVLIALAPDQRPSQTAFRGRAEAGLSSGQSSGLSVRECAQRFRNEGAIYRLLGTGPGGLRY